MPSTSFGEHTNPKPKIGLFSLKPRQVLLAELNAKSAPSTMNSSAEIKSVLIHSVLSFLDSNSFSKTLKRFLSEAQIQDDSWKACSFNLEEIFIKNYKTCDTKSVMLEKEVQPEINGAAAEDVKKKKKKKNDAIETNSAALKEHANNLEMDEQNKKEKDKKKRKNKSGPELNELVEEQEQPELIPSVPEEKGKKKKNKFDKSSNEDGEKVVGKEKKEKSKDGKKKNKHSVEKCSTEDDSIKEDIISKEKNSKKRKRSVSEESPETEILQESKINDPVVKVENGKSEKKKSIENGQASENHLQDSSVKRQDNEEDNSDAGRSAKKQRIDSAEPKSAANAFRRVKVEEVVFTDERLTDNSYWAKGGADIGYGAKAQDVLGQVKGKGFRHEKTKKKRGSYRGGQIDLESHSVKFNYSEEE